MFDYYNEHLDSKANTGIIHYSKTTQEVFILTRTRTRELAVRFQVPATPHSNRHPNNGAKLLAEPL